jgi:hypothetical protein
VIQNCAASAGRLYYTGRAGANFGTCGQAGYANLTGLESGVNASLSISLRQGFREGGNGKPGGRTEEMCEKKPEFGRPASFLPEICRKVKIFRTRNRPSDINPIGAQG